MSSQPAKPQRILIVLFGAIGDVCQALPLLIRLRSAIPDGYICWAIEPKSSGLVLGHPALDEVLVFDRPRGVRGYVEFVREVRGRGFDLVLDLQRHFKSGVTSWLSGASRRIGFNRANSREFNWIFASEQIPPQERYFKKIAHFQLFGDALGLPEGEPLEFGLRIDSELARKWRGELSGSKRVGIVLGSSWESKNWPEEHFVTLIDLLLRRGDIAVGLIGGAGEKGASQRILSHLGKREQIQDYVGSVPLRELPTLISVMDLVVSGDSGPAHISAAVRTRTITLWGPTSAARSAPYGQEDLVMIGKPPCAPCYLKRCPGLGQICLREITPEMVLQRVLELAISPKIDAI